MSSRKKRILECGLLLIGLTILFLATLFAVSYPGQGKTIVVDRNGNGDYEIIQEGIDAAEDGDTVEVWQGTYEENITVNKAINLVGNGSDYFGNSRIERSGSGAVVAVAANWCNITGFAIYGGTTGISVSGMENVTISNVRRASPSSGGNSGIFLGGCANVTVKDTISKNYNEVSGFKLSNSHYCVLYNVSAGSNSDNGIYLWQSHHNQITNSLVRVSDKRGLYSWQSSHNTIKDTNFSTNNDLAISFYRSHYNTLQNCSFWDNRQGIDLEESRFNVVDSGEVIEGRGKGFYLHSDSHNNFLTNITFLNNPGAPIQIREVNNITISNCNLTDNHYAMSIFQTYHTRVYNNTMVNCGISVYTGLAKYWRTLEIDNSNSVNGKPVRFLKDQENVTISQTTGQILLFNCSNATVKDVDVSNSTLGLCVHYCSNITVRNVMSNNNTKTGIELSYSNYCTAENLNCSSGNIGLALSSVRHSLVQNLSCLNGWNGIYVTNSENNVLRNITCSSNSMAGINLESYIRAFTISDSFFSGNHYGIRISSADEQTILNSTITGNTIGVEVGRYSEDCVIHDSKIFENTDSGIDSEKIINATDCWWGDRTGPYHPTKNPEGKGDNITDNVLFDPWTGMIPVVVYVDDDAPGGGNGSKERPYNKIQDGIDNALDGYMVRVYSGTYNENIVVNQPLDLRGSGSDSTTIVGDGSGSVVEISSEWCNMTRFTVTGSGNGQEDAGVLIKAASFNVWDCVFQENDGHGVFADSGESITITNNVFEKNGLHGLLFEGGETCLIANNSAWNHSRIGSFGLAFKDVEFGILTNNSCQNNYGGIWLSDCESFTVNRSSCSNNGFLGIRIDSLSEEIAISDMTCSNNGEVGIFIDRSTGISVTSSNCSGNKQGLSLEGSSGNELSELDCHDNRDVAILISDGSDNNKVSKSRLSGSENGIWILDASDGNFVRMCVISATEQGILVEAGGTACEDTTVWRSFLSNCGDHGVHASDNGAESVEATENWWGHSTGPYHPTENPDGQGEAVTDNVIFDPWILYDPLLTLYVDDDASQAGDGSWERPFQSVQDAVDSAGDGYTIRVFEGHYVETITVGKTLSFVGNGTGATILDGDGKESTVLVKARWCNITKFSVTGGGSGDAGIMVEQGYFRLSESRCEDNKGAGLYIACDDPVYIVNNSFLENTNYGVIFYNGAREAGPYSLVSNNVCENNSLYGIRVLKFSHGVIANNSCSGHGHSGISLESSSSFNSVFNNTCSYNTHAGIAVYSSETGPNSLFRNNCDFNGVGISLDRATENQVFENVCQNNSKGMEIDAGANDNSVFNNTILGSTTYGVYFYNCNRNIFTNNTVSDNREGFVFSEYGGDNRLHYNLITRNHICGVNGSRARDPVNASWNWWGHTSGPHHGTENPNGSGDLVTDNVIFDPWQREPPMKDYVRPVAILGQRPPAIVLEGGDIRFSGTGTPIEDLTGFSWSSSLDGELYNDSSAEFSTTSLSTGNHTISYQVQDIYGIWSDPQTLSILIHDRPAASITDITPDHPLATDKVIFNGNGSDDDDIVRCVWASSLDGELYNGTNLTFTIQELSLGNHTISFRVQDNHGVWSEEATMILVVHQRPEVSINSSFPDVILLGQTVYFRGEGEDDGEIIRYVWFSSLDGELHNDTGPLFSKTLSKGNHSISFLALDDKGTWSRPQETTLLVHEPPVAETLNFSPNPALSGREILFQGEGKDDGSIVLYVWRTEFLELYNGSESSFSNNALPSGTYTIYLRVKDDHDVWSDEVSGILNIHDRPATEISPLATSLVKSGELVRLKALASDDGSVVRYVWTSSLDGEVYNGTDEEIELNDLSLGEHTLSLVVQDDLGAWSSPKNVDLTVEKEEDQNDKNDFILFQSFGPLPVFAYLGLLIGVCVTLVVLVVRRGRDDTKRGVTENASSFTDHQSQLQPAQQTPLTHQIQAVQTPQLQYPSSQQQFPQAQSPPQAPSSDGFRELPGLDDEADLKSKLATGDWTCSSCSKLIPGKFVFCLYCGRKR